MPNIDASIPLGVKVPDGMTTFGNLLNTARSAQALQLGNVELQKNEIALQERKGIQQMFRNPDSFKGEDGQIDYNKLITEGMKVAPTTFPTMVPQIIQAHKSGIDAEQALSNLNESTRAGAGQWFMAQRGKPLEQVAAEALGIKKLNPALAPAIDSSLRALQYAAKGGQEGLDDAYMRLGRAAMPASQQVDAMTPSGPVVNSGTQTVQMNVKPTAGPTGPVQGTSVAMAVPPASKEDIVQDSQGNRFRAVKGADGRITIEPLEAKGAAGAPSTPPMMTRPPGETAESQAALMQEREVARNTLSQAPILHATNRGVLEEIDNVAATGTLGPRTQAVMSAAGAVLKKGWGGATAEEKASAYDMVGKYLERNALQAAQGMGPQTNAGLESQIKAQGTVKYNPTAIKRITKLNDALVSGAEAYQPGLEKAISSSPNHIFAKREFDQAWAQNFDPRIMQLDTALKTGDKAEGDAIIRSIGGPGSAGARELQRKARNLEALSTQGRLDGRD